MELSQISFPVRFDAGDVNIRHPRYASSVPMMYISTSFVLYIALW